MTPRFSFLPIYSVTRRPLVTKQILSLAHRDYAAGEFLKAAYYEAWQEAQLLYADRPSHLDQMGKGIVLGYYERLINEFAAVMDNAGIVLNEAKCPIHSWGFENN